MKRTSLLAVLAAALLSACSSTPSGPDGVAYQADRSVYTPADNIVTSLVNTSEVDVGYNLCTAVLEQLKPEWVTPGVVFLCSEEAPTGAILTAGGGAFALSRIVETEGVYLGHEATVESVRDSWGKIADEAGQAAYMTGGEQTQKFFRKMQGG